MISNSIKNALQDKQAVDRALDGPTDSYGIDSHKAEIIEHIENGLTIIAVAKLIACNPQTLSKWLIQNQSDNDIQKALIIALIKEPKGPDIDSISQCYYM